MDLNKNGRSLGTQEKCNDEWVKTYMYLYKGGENSNNNNQKVKVQEVFGINFLSAAAHIF